MILQDTLQVSLAEHKSREEQKARENVELVKKLVGGSENVIDDSSPPRNDEPQIPGTRLELQSDKESLEVERTNDEEVEVTNVVIPVNVNEEEDEITNEVYELKRREKGKIVEESRSTPLPTPIRSPRTHTNLVSSNTEKLQELTKTHTQTTSSSRSQNTKLSRANRLLSLFKAKPARFKRYKNFFQELQGRYTYLFGHLKERFLSRKSFDTLADHLQEVMVKSLPTMVDTHIKEQVKKQVPEQMKFENLQVPQTTCRPSVVRPRDQDDPHDDAHPKGENSAKRQKTSEYEAYVSGESSSGQVNKEERGPSTLVSQDFIEEVSLTIDEAKLKKMANEMLRQRCTLGDEHQYHIDQMKNFLKSDINPHAKILYIKKQKEPGKPKEEVYSNSKIIQVIKTYWELGHEHKFITEIVVPDYAETGLLWSLSVFIRSSVIWEIVHDFQLVIESYQQKVNLTAPIISFLGVEKHKMFSIIYEPVHGIIYKNSKKEKTVMRHSEIHKFCDATLNRVLEGLKSYNNDVKYGHVQRELTNDEVGYLKLFEEEIEVRLKYHNQMRRWEMYVNRRPLGPRRERPE
ncbi:hypothetical protein Tco_0621039 [Tanacetum coccineum]